MSSRFIADPDVRADVIALYAFDYELGRATARTSNAALAQIRLTWWAEVVDDIYEGRPVRHHPTAQALARSVRRRGLPRNAVVEAVERRFDVLEGETPSEALAVGYVTEAAAFVLDSEANREAARELGRAWAAAKAVGSRPDAQIRGLAARISAKAFPAVAHLALAGRGAGELTRRLRLTWAVAVGRL
jgi:phytoene synthase